MKPLLFNPDFAVTCKTCPEGADESPKRALSGLTLTKMLRILRQPKANFAAAKFGFKLRCLYYFVELAAVLALQQRKK